MHGWILFKMSEDVSLIYSESFFKLIVRPVLISVTQKQFLILVVFFWLFWLLYIFQRATWPHTGHLLKGSFLRASYTKSAPCLVGCPYICRWRYVFHLSRDPTRPIHWGVIHIYGWHLLTVCHHPKKFGDHRHSDG